MTRPKPMSCPRSRGVSGLGGPAAPYSMHGFVSPCYSPLHSIRSSLRMLMRIGDRPAQAELVAHADHPRVLQLDFNHFFALDLPLFLVR